MERAGFVCTVLAGLLTCILFSWQGYEGARADWVSGFLCVMWSLLMLSRLMVLTAPPPSDSGQSHLAYRILYAFEKNNERKRQQILRQSFGTPFVVFLLLGAVLVAWQIFCAVFAASHPAMAGLAGAVQGFFAESGTSPGFVALVVFDWGQGFFYLLCLAMMGFLLRSYAGQQKDSRIVLLILAAYIATGWITFFGFTVKGMNADLGAGLIGYGPVGDVLYQGAATLFDRLVIENGILGIAFMACLLFVPLAFIWLSLEDGKGRDWLTILSGSLAGLSLFCSVFLTLHPALDGFLFLCWMGVFLAWANSERKCVPLAA